MLCTRCEAHDNAYGINCQKYFGTAPCRYLFYGEMFGKTECEMGEPFVGKAGDILGELLGKINLNKSDVCISNVCKCYIFNNKTPSKSILDSCFIHITREINEIKPEIIVAMGASACYSLTDIPTEEFKYYVGKYIYSKKINRNVYIINHPAAILYNPNKKKDLERDFLKIPELLNEKPFEIKKFEYIVIDSQDKFDKMFEDLNGSTIFLDLETEGLDPYNKELKIRTIQLGNGKNIYVVIPEMFNKNINKLKILLESNPISGQDFAFDVKWLFVKYGIFVENWEDDNCLAEYTISGLKDNDLNFLVGKYVPQYYGYWENVPKGGAHLIQNKKDLYDYGSSDIGVLPLILKKQTKALYKTKQYDFYKNILLPCNKVLTKMSLRGIKIDLDHLYKIDEKYRKRAEKAEFIAKTLSGIKETEAKFNKEFNHRSTPMLRWLLLNYYKLPVLQRTKSSSSYPDGQPKIAQKEMEEYAVKHKNKYCKTMLNYRSLQAIRKNFLSGIVPKLQKDIAHTTYSLHATTSGRPNSREPNLLNVPREKDIKKCYIARDGYKFVYGDEAQLEVRTSAVVYREPKLIEICNDLSKDIHSSITAKAFNRNYEEIYNGYKNDDVDITELRVKGKAVQFGVIYQQQAESLGYSLGISTKQAQKFIDDYFKNFPSLYDNIEKTKKRIIEYGFLYNYFRFKREWKNHKAEDHGTLREGVNFLIQSLAFNLIQIAMIKIDNILTERKMRSALVLQVYDSIIVEAIEEEVDEVVFIMKDIMENVNKPYDGINDVLLSVDIATGYNLADLKKYENI